MLTTKFSTGYNILTLKILVSHHVNAQQTQSLNNWGKPERAPHRLSVDEPWYDSHVFESLLTNTESPTVSRSTMVRWSRS